MTRAAWTRLLAICLPLVTACHFGAHWGDDDEDWDDDDGYYDDDDGRAPVAQGTDGPPAVEPPCPVGGAGCPCTSGGVCDPGLECQAQLHTCVIPDTCPIGAAGCECTEGGTCDEGFICKQETCVSEMPCHSEDTGAEGCQCTPGGGCDPGLSCLSDFCVDVPEAGSSESGAEETGATGG